MSAQAEKQPSPYFFLVDENQVLEGPADPVRLLIARVSGPDNEQRLEGTHALGWGNRFVVTDQEVSIPAEQWVMGESCWSIGGLRSNFSEIPLLGDEPGLTQFLSMHLKLPGALGSYQLQANRHFNQLYRGLSRMNLSSEQMRDQFLDRLVNRAQANSLEVPSL